MTGIIREQTPITESGRQVKRPHEKYRSLTLEQIFNERVYFYTNESGTADAMK